MIKLFRSLILQPVNINTPTEVLLRELFDIQKAFLKLGVSEKHRETISKIGLKAFNDYMGEKKENENS